MSPTPPLRSVLVVEDNPDHRMLMERALREAGFVVTTSISGEDALGKLDGVDLVLVDYRLPRMNGIELLHTIRERVGPPVVIVTGVGSEDVAVEALRAGAVDYIVKAPRYLSSLAGALRRAWRSHHLAQRAAELEVSLHEEVALNASLLEAISDAGDGVAIVDSATGRFLYANDALCRIYGYERDELMDLGSMLELVPTEEHAELADRLRRRLAGEPRPARDETTVIRKDGRRITIEYSVVRFAPNDSRLVATVQDVSEAKRSKDRLLASEARFRSLVESAPDAMVMVDTDGTIVQVNNEALRLFGYEAGELVGLSIETLVPDDLRPAHTAHRHHYLDEPHRRAMGDGLDLRARRKDGGVVPVEISLAPIETEDDLLIVAAVRDATVSRRAKEVLYEALERERAASEHLRELDETKSVFLEAVSHELRTPLTVIVGVASLLEDGDLRRDDTTYAELVSSVSSSAHRLERLLDDLLDLDRLRRGVSAPKRQRTAVGELIATVVGNMHIDDRVVHVGSHEIFVDVDPAQTERIVENLVANAVKHTPVRTDIWVRAEPFEAGVLIVVEDAGSGVADEIKGKIFAPFVKTSDRHVAGTGLGLSLIAHFAALHGGRAWVEDRPGGGASFRVYLPGIDAGAEHPTGQESTDYPATRPPQLPDGRGSDRVRVVVADDTDEIRLLLRLQFTQDPRFVVVGEAGDGQEAIALAEAEQPDLVVLDRQMPVLGGMEAMPEIRRRAPNTAIVLYSAHTDADTYQAALDAGALDVLDKLGGGLGLVERLVDVLLERASATDATTEVHVGPVSAEAARVWVSNTLEIIDAVAAHPEVLDEEIPDDVLDLFRSFLRQWEGIAATTDEFRWVARAAPADVSRIVGYWAAIDRMTDEQLARLGIQWCPPEGEPFFRALTAGVLEALRRHEETQRLAARLGEQWARYQATPPDVHSAA